MQLDDFEVLTFDTFGTLIDWETGLQTAMAALVAKLDNPPRLDEILEQFARAETEQQAATPDMRYAELLAVVYRRLADDWGVPVSDAQAREFGGSVGNWPAFADAKEALGYLREHFTLITLTNCDRASYRGSAARLGDPWHAVYTAEDIGSYKPAAANFEYLIEHVMDEFGKPPSSILHVAQSLFHDHVPATAIGLRTAWIDRRHQQESFGATARPGGDYRIDFRFNSMAELVAAHRGKA